MAGRRPGLPARGTVFRDGRWSAERALRDPRHRHVAIDTVLVPNGKTAKRRSLWNGTVCVPTGPVPVETGLTTKEDRDTRTAPRPAPSASSPAWAGDEADGAGRGSGTERVRPLSPQTRLHRYGTGGGMNAQHVNRNMTLCRFRLVLGEGNCGEATIRGEEARECVGYATNYSWRPRSRQSCEAKLLDAIHLARERLARQTQDHLPVPQLPAPEQPPCTRPRKPKTRND